jgi:hypothetical protein
MARAIFGFNTNDQIVIDDSSRLYQKYETFGKNADMIYLHLNSERAHVLLLKLYKSPPDVLSEIVNDNVSHELSKLDLKWEPSYHYKSKEGQSGFLHNAEEKIIAARIQQSLGLKKTNVEKGKGDSMEHSIYKCLETMDFKFCPFYSEKTKGHLILIQEMRGHLTRNLSTALDGNNIQLHPYLMKMAKNDLLLERDLFSKQPRKNVQEKWHPLQYWATELFAEICKCNIMIFVVRKSIHCQDHLLAPYVAKKRKQNTIEQDPTMWEYAVRCASERAFDPTKKTIYISYEHEEKHYSPLVAASLVGSKRGARGRGS